MDDKDTDKIIGLIERITVALEGGAVLTPDELSNLQGRANTLCTNILGDLEAPRELKGAADELKKLVMSHET
jgi:hypothetical protein